MKELVQKILLEDYEFKEIVKRLKDKSHYYPSVVTEIINNTIYVSTLVRVFRDGKWWKVHCVNSAFHEMLFDASELMSLFCESVYKIQLFYIVNGRWDTFGRYEDLDECQLSEEERLIQHFKT